MRSGISRLCGKMVVLHAFAEAALSKMQESIDGEEDGSGPCHWASRADVCVPKLRP